MGTVCVWYMYVMVHVHVCDFFDLPATVVSVSLFRPGPDSLNCQLTAHQPESQRTCKAVSKVTRMHTTSTAPLTYN